MAERARLRIVAAVAAGSLALAACASEPPSPAQQHKASVEARLAATFSRTQARCVLDQLEPATLQALDRRADLPADSDELEAYSNAVIACVVGLGG